MKFRDSWGFNGIVDEEDFVPKYVAGYPDHGEGQLETMGRELERLTEITTRIFKHLPPSIIKRVMEEEGYVEVKGE